MMIMVEKTQERDEAKEERLRRRTEKKKKEGKLRCCTAWVADEDLSHTSSAAIGTKSKVKKRNEEQSVAAWREGLERRRRGRKRIHIERPM